MLVTLEKSREIQFTTKQPRFWTAVRVLFLIRRLSASEPRFRLFLDTVRGLHMHLLDHYYCHFYRVG